MLSLRYALPACRACRIGLLTLKSSSQRSSRFYSSDVKPEKEKLKILFCGSDIFSTSILQRVLEASDVWSSLTVLTSPLDPRARRSRRSAAELKGKHFLPSIREFAEDNDIRVLSVPEQGLQGYRLPEPFIEETPHDLLLTASFGYIIPDNFLHRFKASHRLNVHPSLLPKYRGAAPIQWTIANGDTETAVTVQRLVEKSKGIDAGEIVGSVQGIPVTSDETYWTLMPKVINAGGDLVVDVLRQIRDGNDKATAQDSSLISRAPKIKRENARIDWSWNAKRLEAFKRGISHQESLWTAFPDTVIERISPKDRTGNVLKRLTNRHFVHLTAFTVLSEEDLPPVLRLGEHTPGTGYYEKSRKRLLVCCGRESEGFSWIEVQAVRMAGRKEIAVSEWWNGLPRVHRVKSMIQFV